MSNKQIMPKENETLYGQEMIIATSKGKFTIPKFTPDIQWDMDNYHSDMMDVVPSEITMGIYKALMEATTLDKDDKDALEINTAKKVKFYSEMVLAINKGLSKDTRKEIGLWGIKHIAELSDKSIMESWLVMPNILFGYLNYKGSLKKKS